MKYNKVITLHLTSILHCFMISIFAIIMFGCSNSKSQNEETSQSEEEQIVEDQSSNVLPVVVCKDDGDDRYDNLRSYHFAFKSNGEYIAFDNDADYQTWCALATFFDKIFLRVVGADSDFGYKSVREWCNSAEFVSLMESLPELVNLYISGKKNVIQDKRVYKIIDSAWYDIHPDRMNYSLSRDWYGHKEYKSVYHHCDFSCLEDPNFKELNGCEVPLGTLICNYYLY